MEGDLGHRITAAVAKAQAAGNGAAVAAALGSVEPAELVRFLHVTLEVDPDVEPLTRGMPASPGAASGRIMLSSEAAMAAADLGDAVILMRRETTPDDVLGMQASAGIVTCRGGLASHAAVVARGWGIAAVVGADEIRLDDDTITIGSTVLSEGDVVTIDGGSGEIFAGQLVTAGQEPPPELTTLLAWADAVAAGHVEVRANADTAADAAVSRRMGARGIGLCRTEHMFLEADRLSLMRRFILTDDDAVEAEVLSELEDAQRADFQGLLAAMDGLPVTVRLLDLPLHEFLPDLLGLVAREANGTLDEEGRIALAAVRRLHEVNPMIGTRGARLGILRTGLYQMQLRALFGAAANLIEKGLSPHVEVMVPMVVDAEELRLARGLLTRDLDEFGHPELTSDVVSLGAMIETPRAALTAGVMAEHVDFFSFGTNDLTQLTYAFSRDDIEVQVLPTYLELGILPANPFAVLDPDGVGELVRIGCEGARANKPDIRLGVCGEHAGDPASVDFLVRLGVGSVSCSPFRVPLVRLAVAQTLLDSGRVALGDITFDFAASQGAVIGGSRDHNPVALSPDPGAAFDIDESLVLHVLRVRGFVTADGFMESLGVYPVAVVAALTAAEEVRHIEARDMYALLPSGKERHELLLDTYAPEAVQARLAEAYPAFLELNDAFKSLCARWQLRGDQPNDHADPEYDRACVDDLGQVHERAQPIIETFAGALSRMVRYGPRLRAAKDQVVAGDTRKFTGVACGSFHDIWMELHEDLIVLQRIERAQEGSF